jgi:hypothetical protein
MLDKMWRYVIILTHGSVNQIKKVCHYSYMLMCII